MAKWFPFLAGDARPWAGLGLCLALSVCLHGPVQAQATAGGDALAPFEQTLFSRDFAGDPTPSRLDRLENSVFGSTQSGSDAERQARLIRSLSAAQEVIPKAPASKANSGNADDSSSGISQYAAPGSASGGDSDPDANADPSGSGMSNAAPPGDSDYPTVTALEREVFARDFIREDVAHRLDRLEKRTFGEASPNMALSDRVDRLMARYPNAASDVARYTRAASGGASNDSGVSSALRDLPSDSSQFVGTTDTYAKVGALEKRFFNGKTYAQDLLTQRLDRLETKAYGQPYSGQSIDTRVNRLLSAYKVGPKRQTMPNNLMTQPDPAKWQDPSTVGYTGSFLSQSRGGGNFGNSGSNYSSTSAAPPQNIQIGAGFSSTNNSASSYSPEMVSMLPASMQQQMAGSMVQQQSTTTMVGAPGTVITQQDSTNPGFQTYGGQPLQTYNYYGNPGQTQMQSSTTVIQPNGSQVTGPMTYNSSQTAMMPNNPNGLPTPAYVGNPTVLQNLGNLEINLYGQVDMMNPVAVRLARLETMLLHQVYPNYPDAQRVANLQRAYQVQSVGRVLGNGKAANIERTAGSMLFGVPLNTPNTAMPYNAAPYSATPYNPNYAPVIMMPPH